MHTVILAESSPDFEWQSPAALIVVALAATYLLLKNRRKKTTPTSCGDCSCRPPKDTVSPADTKQDS